jgi:hypothetical protein
MTDRKANQRVLNSLGFVHVAGWVREEDAAPILRKIEEVRKEVDAIKAEKGTQ